MPTKRDQTAQTIFSQLELLKEMAVSIDDNVLATELQTLLDRALSRYCEAKREALGATLALHVRKCA